MASHYDRLASPYATRPTPIVGPSRGDPYYDRERRIIYPPRAEANYIEEERLSTRRDDRLFYSSQEFIPPAESRGESRNNAWSRRPPVYHPHPSPPPAPIPRHYEDTRTPPISQWEARPRWEHPPNEHGFEPSAAWRQARREPSYPRLNSLVNPIPSITESDDLHWREPVLTPIEPPLSAPRDYGRSYGPVNHVYDDRYPTHYERPPYLEENTLVPNDTYRRPPAERANPSHWENPTYRPEIIPAPRISRPSASTEYVRPRQVPMDSSDSDSSRWTRERAKSTRHSREGSLSSPSRSAVFERGRTASRSYQLGARNAVVSSVPSSPQKHSRTAWDFPVDELEYSLDDSGHGVLHPTHSLKQTLSDITRSREFIRENERRNEFQGGGESHNQTASARPLATAVQPMTSHAWDPSTDQWVPLLESNIPTSAHIEHNIGGPRRHVYSLDQPSADSARTYELMPHATRSSEPYPARNVITGAAPSGSAQGGSSRHGVMSVHDLVSPTPIKPYTPPASSHKAPTPMLLDDDSQIDTWSHKELDITRDARPLDGSAPLMTRARLIESEEVSMDHPAFSATSQPLGRFPREDQPGRSLSEEVRAVGRSQVVTPDIWAPAPDADRRVAEIEAGVGDATLSSPKPSITLLPGERVSRDGTMRILAPRPKAEEKDITETLRKAIVLRRVLETQSREQRVNPILMDNLAKSDGPEQKSPPTSATVFEEVVEHVLTQNEEDQMNVRAVLATTFAEQREALAEKMQGLRDEYMELHDRWLAHCARLDSLFKANDMQEALTQAGRTTRRSATTLGDAVRSDLEMEQIIASLGNEDLTDPNHLAVRNVATIPDMICVEKGRIEYLFDDTNNLVGDPASFYDSRSGFCDWTPEEEAIFYEKYAEYPKQFGIIAEFLPHKTSHQCVLYYYIRKKRLIDFRKAANSGNGKRRRGGGVRKSGKQKGNALLADVAQADSKRPAGRGRRRGRGGFADASRGRGGGPPPPTESADDESRARRRRVANGPKQYEFDDALSADTDTTREASVLPPKKRRGRKPKSALAVDSPGESPAPAETRFVDGNEPTRGRKLGATATYWSESDREIFMRLLARHGKDFKRISAELPNKTSVQVGNYYKNHNRELGLEKIALAAANRVPSPDQDRFITMSRAEASQYGAATEESSVDQLVDRQVADATSGVSGITLEQNGKSGQSVFRTAPNQRVVHNNSVINVLDLDSFQTAGMNKPKGVTISPNGQAAYTLDMIRQPVHTQTSASMTSTAMNLQGAPETPGSVPSSNQEELHPSNVVELDPTVLMSFQKQFGVRLPDSRKQLGGAPIRPSSSASHGFHSPHREQKGNLQPPRDAFTNSDWQG